MADGFQERYEVAAEYLLGELPSDCGMGERDLTRAEKHFGLRLPPTLRDYYLALGNLDELNDAHDHLLLPKDWFMDGGKLVFKVENQAVVYWGVEATEFPEDDPPVFQGVNLPRSVQWHLEHERCSEFLLVTLHWQAVMGGFKWLGTADAGHEVLQYFDKHWRRVGTLEGLIAFRREGRAACFLGDSEPWSLWVGGRSQELFEQARAELQAAGIGLKQL